ncbi:MAG: Ig-like domain-containing protein [Patescibacteria group bacterium]|nr:Ig-like domain-containing protein [Patescibacteria group bacterium]
MLVEKSNVRKICGYLAILLMLSLTFGPFFNYFKFPEKVKANASTTWTKYGSNPVLSDSEMYYQRVVKVGDTYHLWTENLEGISRRLYHYTSADGLTWSSKTQCTDPSGAVSNVHEPSVIYDSSDSKFKIWYESVGGASYIGYRSSSDGVVWSAESSTSFTFHIWENNGLYAPVVIKDGDTYKMWYQAFTSMVGEDGDKRIDYATSTNGTTWDNTQNLGQVTFDGSTANNIVLTVGTSGQWDDNSIYSHDVIKNSDNTYEMWYSAENGDNYYKIGYSTSADGVTGWMTNKSEDNPILSPGIITDWDWDGVLFPTVIEDGTTYRMWYRNAAGTKMGYATAPAVDSGDHTAPTITNITSDAMNGSYNAGDTIDIDVTFSENITSTGNVIITLETGDTDRTCTLTVSNAASGSCNYTVMAGDTSSDLNVLSVAGTISDQASNPMVSFTPATNLSANKDIVIDTTNPTISFTTNDYYNSDNWLGSISGTASDTGSGVSQSRLTVQRSSDSKYWDGDSWETSSTWLTATGTTSWSYSLASSNLTNGSGYKVIARSTDAAGNNSANVSDLFMYNSQNWVKFPTNPIRGLYNIGTFFGNLMAWILGEEDLSAPTEEERMFNNSSIMYGSVMRGTVSDIIIASKLNTQAVKGVFKDADFQSGDINGYGIWFSKDNGIYLAVSPNGSDWLLINNYEDINIGNLDEISGDPVMTLGASGSFDDYAIFEPHVIWDDTAEKYKMWYAAMSDVSTNSIGYAESTDGVTWTNRQQVLTTGLSAPRWDYGLVRNPRVIQVSATEYKMWYVGNNIKYPDAGWNSGWQIGYATSTDGINWTKSESNPVLTKGTNPDWDYANTWGFDVLKRGSIYEMFFSGNGSDTHYKIGHAYSEDGVAWKKYSSNPIINVGGDGAWDEDAIFSPMVAYDSTNNAYEMFYFGRNVDSKYNLGFATMNAAADATKPYTTMVIPGSAEGFVSDTEWPNSMLGMAYDSRGINTVDVQVTYESSGTTYYWNGATWTVLESWNEAMPILGYLFWKYDLNKTNLIGGTTYTITARATDAYGNVETNLADDSRAGFTYDDSAPSSPAVYDGLSGADIGSVESLSTLSAHWDAASDPESGIDEYQYAIGTTPGGTDVVNWTWVEAGQSITKNGLSLAVDQTYYFSVRAENGAYTLGAAGNSNGQTVVDLTAPTITMAGYPSTLTNNARPEFTGSTVDLMTNISKIEYKVDDGLWTMVGSSYSAKSANYNLASPLLSDGQHTMYLRSSDLKDNISQAASYTFTVDTQAPQAPVISSPASGQTLTNSTPTFEGTAEVNSTILLTVSGDTKSYTTNADSSGKWSFTIPSGDALSAGQHSLEAKAQDSAGNISTASTANFSVEPTQTATSVGGANDNIALTASTVTPTPTISVTPSATVVSPITQSSPVDQKQTANKNIVYLWLYILAILAILIIIAVWLYKRFYGKST